MNIKSIENALSIRRMISMAIEDMASVVSHGELIRLYTNVVNRCINLGCSYQQLIPFAKQYLEANIRIIRKTQTLCLSCYNTRSGK